MSEHVKYQDKVVVITGASSGFGRGTAIELLKRGCSVVLAARNEEKLKEVAGGNAKALVVPTDVSDPPAIADLAAKAVAAFGRIDVWINDAGVAAIGKFDEVPLVDHEQVIKTDLLGTVYGSHHAMKHFRTRGGGILINVASMLGKVPTPLYASYVASKFGVIGLCDAIRQELGEEKNESIHICTVMPMAHDTEFFEHAANYTGKQAVPIPPIYDPQVTIDALVKLVIEPEDEVITGWQGGPFGFLHRLMPKAIEKIMAKNTEKSQLQAPPPAPPTSGNVHHTV